MKLSLFKLFDGFEKKLHAKEETADNGINETPTLRDWKQNKDGSISGNISFTTSKVLEKELSEGKVVTTIAGSKYKLQGKGTTLEEPSKRTFFIGNKKPPLFDENVQKMRNWKENADGSISGKIHGSDRYKDDVFVTTSPLKGRPSANNIVTTISGTKYFLEGEGTTKNENESVSHSWQMV